MSKPDFKEQLRSLILRQLKAEYELQTQAAELAHDEAISEESRPENKYDTHSQEAAYLAEGQAKLAAEIAESITFYQSLALPAFSEATPLALGALVQLSSRRGDVWYFLGPRAGGLEVELPEHGSVCVLTPQSPLGRQLLGKRQGDTVALPGRGDIATISQVR
jgi:hypothetical protein